MAEENGSGNVNTATALRITEIQCCIFAHVQSKSSLARLARTCRSFQDCALDALYEDVQGLQDLLRCMTNDVCGIAGNQIVLRRPLKTTDIVTLKSYGTRVRKLVLDNSVELAADFAQALCIHLIHVRSHNHTPILTTKLVSLWWLDHRQLSTSLLPLFLPQGLKKLVLSGEYISTTWHSSIPDFCPNLKEFKVALYNHREERDVEFVGQWSRLEVLRCGPLSARALKRISMLPLQKLSLSHQRRIPNVSSSRLSFPHLHTLEVDAEGDISYLKNLIKTCQFPKLTSLTLSCWDTPSRASLTSLFLALQRGHFQLRELTFSASPSGDAADLTAALLGFRGLTVLSFPGACFCDVGDEELERLAKASPNLEVLDLGGMTDGILKPRITFGGLVTLLRHCPELRTLDLTVDTTYVDMSIDRSGVRNTQIKSLILYSSPIGNVEQVALFLSDILPSVKMIDAAPRNEWKMVEVALKVAAAVRARERS